MTVPILLQFIEKVYKTNLDYCVICLRTSQERRLEKPVYLKKFIENVSSLSPNEQCFVFDREQQLACFVCERQAAGAARFLAALGLASQAHRAVQRLLLSPVLRNHLRTGFQQYLTNQSKPDVSEGAPESLLLLETKLRQQRVHSQLLPTEVLMVSTPSTVDCAPDPTSSDCEVTSGPGESRDMYVIPDLLPVGEEEQTSDTLDLKDESDIKLESIIIFDDDDPIPIDTQPSLLTHTATPRLQTLAPGIGRSTPGPKSIGLTAPGPQSIGARICMSQPGPNSIGAKICKAPPGPKSTGPRKGLITPKVNNKSSESRTESDARVVPTEQLSEPTASPLILSTPSFILHPLVFNSGMMTVPTLAANIMEGQLVTSLQNTLTFEVPELAFQNENNIEFITEPEKVVGILKKLSHHEASKVFIFKPMSKAEHSADTNNTVDLDSQNLVQISKKNDSVNSSVKIAPICAVGEARSLESEERDGINASDSGGREERTRSDERKGRNGVRGSETPQLRSDRIDWEDKIPMDVISFVDETETTCKRSRRSEDQPPPLGISNVTSLTQAADIAVQVDDVIDLC